MTRFALATFCAAPLLACACSSTAPNATQANGATAPGTASTASSDVVASCNNRTMPVDVVLLREGTTTAGSPELTVEHEGYTYRFATATSRETFAANPTEFAAVDGGACGRMGALAGLGDASRYAMLDGRLYFFASEQCRDAFLKAPARYVRTADPVPTGTAASARAGLALVDKWIAWSGGADAVRTANRVTQTAEIAPSAENGNWKVVRTKEVSWTSTGTEFVSVETWTREGDKPAVHRYETGANALAAWERSGENPRTPFAAARRAAFIQQMSHAPIAIMRARFMPGFVAIADGEGDVDGTPVSFASIAFNGSTTRLGIDRQTGELLTASYRDRDSNSLAADVTKRFTRFASAGGLKLPVEWTTVTVAVGIDGAPGPASSASTPTAAPPSTVAIAR
jgi:YHS domain-containing protein